MLRHRAKLAFLCVAVVGVSACAVQELTAPALAVLDDGSTAAALATPGASHQDLQGLMILASADGLENRFTPGGTYHATFDVVALTLVGSIEGTMTFPERLVWTLPDGQRCYFCGSLSGPATVQVTRFSGSDVTAALAGQFTARVRGPEASFAGTVVLQGSGDLEGVAVRLNAEGNLPPFGFVFTYSGLSVQAP